jgi:hypothetical protein
MPGLAGTIRELEAATASALTRNADPGPSSPDLVVPVVPVDPAVALQTDTAESHVTHQPAQSSRPPLPLAIHEYLVELRDGQSGFWKDVTLLAVASVHSTK